MIIKPFQKGGFDEFSETDSQEFTLQKPLEQEHKAAIDSIVIQDSTLIQEIKNSLLNTMKVIKSEDTNNLIFSWPKFEEIKYYKVYIISDSSSLQITPEKGISDTTITYSENILKSDVLYKWKIIGFLKNGDSVKASKELLFNK